MFAIPFRGPKRGLVWALVGAVVVGVALAGWWFWHQRSQPGALLRHLPAENALILYVDLDQFRSTPALEPLLKQRIEPDPDYGAFVRDAGFDYQKDLDAAAVAYLQDRVYIVARGRFDAGRLRQYAISKGGSCAGAALEGPCRMPASRPGRQVSFLLLSEGVLGLATAPDADAVLRLKTPPAPSAQPLADAAAGISAAPALVWATAAPAALERALSDGSECSPNLVLFSRALAGAERVYLFLSDRSPNIELALHAVCRSEAEAADVRRLLQGLNDLASGLMQGARGRGEQPGDWERVLGSASVRQEQNLVSAVWMLDAKLLENLASVEKNR